MSTTAEIHGQTVKVLPPELKLVYLCVHGAKDGWNRLKWIVDADRIIQGTPAFDWEQALTLARSCRCEKMLLVVLVLANVLLDTPLPPVVTARIQSRRSLVGITQRLADELIHLPERRLRARCFHINHTYLKLLDNGVDQVRYIYRILTYPKARDCSTLGLTHRLLPFWSWLRPIRLFLHCLRKALSRRGATAGADSFEPPL